MNDNSDSITESDQIEDIVQMLTDVGIKIFESTPDADDILMSDDSSDDDMAADKQRPLLLLRQNLDAPLTLYVCVMGLLIY